MKALLKRIKGGLIITSAFLPLAAALGGSATFFWLAYHGTVMTGKAYEEAKEAPAIKELMEDDLEFLKDQLDNKQISVQDYQKKKNYWNSQTVIKQFLKEDKEGNKAYLDKINKAEATKTAGILLSIFYPLVAAIVVVGFFAENFTDVIESGVDNFIEAKAIKEEAKRRKELKKYGEELDEYKEELE